MCVIIYSRKDIIVRIFDDEEYEKNEDFYVELGEPSLTRRGSGITSVFLLESVYSIQIVQRCALTYI